MRLTLDWDDDEARAEHYDDVRAPTLGEPNPWQLRLSSSGSGYHYVEWGAADGWQQVMDLRAEHGDDRKRLRLDRLRHNLGSPFLQVLYRTKYMDRWGWDPDSGNDAEAVDGTYYVPESEQIKGDDGRLDYPLIARLLAEQEYGSQRALAESMDYAPSTVSEWINRDHPPSDPAKKKLRRRARSRGLGHYQETEGGGKSAERRGQEVRYFDPDDDSPDGYTRRRTIVEYADAPWDWNIGGDDREYALLNVHTGTFNDNHSEGQLKYVHDQIMDYVLDLLSPTAQDGANLNLDRETRHSISREQDSVNYESELLDGDESRYYAANMVSTTGAAPDIDVSTVLSQIVFEVILWPGGETTDTEWHLLGIWTGGSVSTATVLSDSQGWW